MKIFEVPPIFQKTTLENGVRVLTEHHPNTRAATAGIFVPIGVRDEPANMIGAAHFIEHMVFKGTKKRTAFDIAAELEAVGGELNAYTTREYTCFHATTLREHLDLSLDVLTDLMTKAQFQKEDFEKERQIVLSEIDMSADDLEEYIFDLFFEKIYKKHPLSRPILGTAESLNGISRKQLHDFYKEKYSASDIIVSVAGGVDHSQVVNLVAQTFGKLKKGSKTKKRTSPKFHPFRAIHGKSSEQVHFLVGQESASYKSKYRFESYILNAVLGGGMTSRLYQKVREKRGLAYSVYSYLQAFTDSGLMMVYAGTSPEYLEKTADLIVKEYQRIYKAGITQKELKFFKRQVTGSILLGADDIENRMNSLGINEMIFGKYRSVDLVLEEINAVSVDSMAEYINKFMNPDKLGVYLLGSMDDAKAEKILRKI